MKNSIQTTKSSPLLFSTSSYPKFGYKKDYDEENPPPSVTKSPYYWWFKFLQLSAEYKATCDANGVGEYAELYKQLGNVHQLNFKEWWKTKAHLFAEIPKNDFKMAVAHSYEELAPFNRDDVFNLVVPLTWSQRSLKKAFNTLILKKVPKSKRGIDTENSTAKFVISSRWNIEAFRTAYEVYRHKESSNNGDKVYWADIAIDAKLPLAVKNGLDELRIANSHTKEMRALLTVIAKRHYSRAQMYIKASLTNSFPYPKNDKRETKQK